MYLPSANGNCTTVCASGYHPIVAGAVMPAGYPNAKCEACALRPGLACPNLQCTRAGLYFNVQRQACMSCPTWCAAGLYPAACPASGLSLGVCVRCASLVADARDGVMRAFVPTYEVFLNSLRTRRTLNESGIQSSAQCYAACGNGAYYVNGYCRLCSELPALTSGKWHADGLRLLRFCSRKT